ncbi:MAG: DNA repair protein RecN [Bacteroidales bacterium]|nr:DNA repair protein RecN [Bacteroidales bacterium]
MLQHLLIRNYALIEQLSIGFGAGFSVITGETGAGKSILLGALGLVLGDRADTGVLYDPDQKCVVEAQFRLDDDRLRPLFEEHDLDFQTECLFRRELTPQKKSRAFINDTPVSLQAMKEIGAQLVDIHSQHDSLLLTDAGFQLQLLDDIAQNGERLDTYRRDYGEYLRLRQELKTLQTLAERNTSENDYLRFQLDELEKARLQEGEYTELEQRLRVMENAEEIKGLLFSANRLLERSEGAILPQLNEVGSALHRLQQLLPDATELQQRLEGVRVELKDIAYDLDRLEEDAPVDEAQLQELQERMDLLNRLMMKHHVKDYEELMTLRDDLKAKVGSFENIDQQIAQCETALAAQTQKLRQEAEALHDARVQASARFSDEVVALARQLAMPHATFQVAVEPLETSTPTGTDQVRFLFSANKGMGVAALDRVASGGELSRLMLSIKSVVSQSHYIPTLIFDEIDTGVSGEVAAKTGGILQQMGHRLQLVAITHLPQVACKATEHFLIYKDSEGDKTQSHIRLLTPQERVTEIAKMLSNDKVTPEAVRAAEVLLTDRATPTGSFYR